LNLLIDKYLLRKIIRENYMGYLGFTIIIIATGLYRWTVRVYYTQPRGNHPALFWNATRATVIMALPLILWIIGITFCFIASVKLGIISAILCLICWIASSRL